MRNDPCRYAGKTVLAVGAHPDDIELGVGGTVAWLRRAGARVIMAVVCIPNRYEIRVEESKRAAAILGGELRFLFNHGCSRVEDLKIYQMVEKLDDLVREFQPAALFSHGPTDVHVDHNAVYRACLASQRIQALDFFCYNPTTSRPTAIPFQPQVYVDISDTLETKMEALKAHASQFSSRGLPTDFLREIAHEHGRAAGVPFAEGLAVVRMILT